MAASAARTQGVQAAAHKLPAMTLRERVAIVVGASGGIGKATALALGRNGASVVLAGLGDTLLDAATAEVQGLGTPVLAVPMDIRVRADIDALVARTIEAFGRVDILVNAAGVATRPSLLDETDADLERVIAINLLGCARTIHAVLPIMRAQRSGSIVSIGSVAGNIGVLGIYSASKFGLRGLSDSVRREVRSFGIGVTLIEPGFVQTPMNPPTPKLPPPEIVADAVVAAIGRPRRSMIIPHHYRVAVGLASTFPGLTDRILGSARVQEQLNRRSRTSRP